MVYENNNSRVRTKGAANAPTPALGRLPSRPNSIINSITKFVSTPFFLAIKQIRRNPKALTFKPSIYLISFFTLVVVPSILAICYLTFIASNQYVAESRFAVRTLQSQVGGETLLSNLSLLGSSVAGTSMMPAITGQDSYIVTDYIHSRAIIDDLSKTIDLHKFFRRQGSDFWARLKKGATKEELTQYWNGMVTTYVDGPSGIVTVAARAFRPEDALTIASAIIHASEKLLNDVSARARNDAMLRAEQEVRRSEDKVQQALLDLRQFRNGNGFIDPTSAATSTSKLLLEVMSEKIRLQNDLFVSSKAMSKDAPTVRTIKSRIDSLDNQIDKLKSQLAGNSAEKTVSNSLAKFEELELKRIFAEKLYTMSQDALERARLRVEQQNLYISVFVPPSLPEDAKYPERISFSFIIPIALCVIWGIFALIGAAVEDHRL